ncbi:HAUS augmin-like complex subunit 7 isoform X1 [Lates japonicus]|uniref:HAUS augmin-like complex subunit 7 isoform X1 n=1 Tax=Lates japonicus TaxID=270547 RepID=A0AAD3QTY6_LATJO|nr:HAUS augmin-like complex subunit 7 isoform X1 [Lates japonicus]
MAGVLEEKERLRLVYASLQAASCPFVEGLNLQEADSMLQLLCTPSHHRTDILAWICSSINPNFATSKAMSMRSKDPDVLTKEMAVLGQELMLCNAGDLDLIRGNVSPHRQLHFMEQLLSLVPGCKKSAEHRMDEEMLVNKLFAAENLPHLTQMLKPTFNPWPAHLKALCKGTKSCYKPSKEEDADVATLIQLTQSALKQLESECEFLNNEAQSPGIFSPSSLRVAACDLQQLMATFCHVYETDLRTYCSRDPPSFSTETDVFRRVHQLLLACNTELEMLNEVSEASTSMNEEVNRLQTQPRYWRRGEKHTLSDQLEEVSRRSREFLSLLHS